MVTNPKVKDQACLDHGQQDDVQLYVLQVWGQDPHGVRAGSEGSCRAAEDGPLTPAQAAHSLLQPSWHLYKIHQTSSQLFGSLLSMPPDCCCNAFATEYVNKRWCS